MMLKNQFAVMCDVCEDVALSQDTESGARDVAETDDWDLDGDEHLCPDCREIEVDDGSPGPGVMTGMGKPE